MAAGGCWRRRWRFISSSLGEGLPRFDILGALVKHRGEAEIKHTFYCPRCIVHYERCIQSLMPQVRDLPAQNLELQRSQQELSQAVASTAGINQS